MRTLLGSTWSQYRERFGQGSDCISTSAGDNRIPPEVPICIDAASNFVEIFAGLPTTPNWLLNGPGDSGYILAMLSLDLSPDSSSWSSTSLFLLDDRMWLKKFIFRIEYLIHCNSFACTLYSDHSLTLTRHGIYFFVFQKLIVKFFITSGALGTQLVYEIVSMSNRKTIWIVKSASVYSILFLSGGS